MADEKRPSKLTEEQKRKEDRRLRTIRSYRRQSNINKSNNNKNK